jgi:serine/threonine-protein kinase
LKLIDFGRLQDGRPYLVTEFLVGRTLEKTISQGPLHPTWTLLILRQICDAMAEAHEQQIIHRDLKPGNIFLERVGDDEIVKVLDFGIAKLAGASTHITAVGSVCGTPCYMSPEQAAGDELDPRSDLYSLGVIGYECLNGKPPFTAAQPAGLLFQHINDTPAALPDNVPQEIAALVMSLLEKDPGKRPQTAREVRARIDQILLKSTIDLEALRCTLETPALNGSSLLPSMLAGRAPSMPAEAPKGNTKPDLRSLRLEQIGALLLLVAVLIAGASWLFLRDGDPAETVAVAPLKTAPIAAAPQPEPELVELEEPQVLAAAVPAPVEEDAEEPPRKRRRAPKRSISAPPVIPTEKGFVDFTL